MRGVYTAHIQTPSGILGGRTLLWIKVPTDRAIEILSASITNIDNDTSEQCEAGLFRATSIVGCVHDGTVKFERRELGDSITPGVIGSGTIHSVEPIYSGAPIDKRGFNILAGYYYDPIPEDRPVISPGGSVGLKLTAGAGTTTTKYDAQIVIREIGG